MFSVVGRRHDQILPTKDFEIGPEGPELEG